MAGMKYCSIVPNYHFRWQETYFLKHRFLLPKGTQTGDHGVL